ncbi:MAG TPA: glycosyltransferase [Syntrophorhabdaceae bacterium]|nr:glycosyltransferase [Syntrophorhabdaceae bacterium]
MTADGIGGVWTFEELLEPDREVLVADDGAGVAEYLSRLTPQRARVIGEAARRRVLTQHTYVKRAAQLQSLFGTL